MGRGNKKMQNKRKRERAKAKVPRLNDKYETIDGNLTYYPYAYCKSKKGWLTLGLYNTHNCENCSNLQEIKIIKGVPYSNEEAIIMEKLNKIKKTTKLLFDIVDPLDNITIMGIVVHPFIDNVIQYGNLNSNDLEGECTFLDIREEDNLSKIRDMWFERIDSCTDILGIYCLVRTPWKLTWLKLIKNYLTNEEFSDFLADAWISSENPNNDANVSKEELVSWFKECKNENIMVPDDLKYFNSLPDEITVWRGVSPGRIELGLSWTDDYEKAKWFKERFEREDQEGYILEAKIRKEDVLVYFNTRSEKELVVNIFSIDKDKIKRL